MTVQIEVLRVYWRSADDHGVVEVNLGLPWGTAGLNNVIRSQVGKAARDIVARLSRDVAIHAAVTWRLEDGTTETRTVVRRTVIRT
mgnify:CR=1 FL=1